MVKDQDQRNSNKNECGQMPDCGQRPEDQKNSKKMSGQRPNQNAALIPTQMNKVRFLNIR